MHESCQLGQVDGVSHLALGHEQTRNNGNAIRNEEALEVLHANLLELRRFLVAMKLDKVETDVHGETNVCHVFDCGELLLAERKHDDERRREERVERERVDDETPNLRQRVFLADDPPLPLRLGQTDVVEDVVLVLVAVLRVVHLVVVLRAHAHFLEEQHEAGFLPEAFDSVFLHQRRQVLPLLVDVVLDPQALAHKLTQYVFTEALLNSVLESFLLFLVGLVLTFGNLEVMIAHDDFFLEVAIPEAVMFFFLFVDALTTLSRGT